MQEIDTEEVLAELQNRPVAMELAAIMPEAPVNGFKHNGESDYIATLSLIDSDNILRYLAVLNQNFGGHLKDFDEPIILGKNVPEAYIRYINRMHGNTFGGVLIRMGDITVEQLAPSLRQQGGGIEHPPLNLTNKQALYVREPDDAAVEIVRICPWIRDPLYTLEYMVTVSSNGKGT